MKDYVKCTNCESVMLVDRGAEECPQCKMSGCLAWVDDKQEVEDDFFDNQIYTQGQWAKDNTFSAKVGQEIEEEIYGEMLNCMSPIYMNSHDGYFERFGMSEPYMYRDDGKALFMTFGKKNGKHYYLGLKTSKGE